MKPKQLLALALFGCLSVSAPAIAQSADETFAEGVNHQGYAVMAQSIDAARAHLLQAESCFKKVLQGNPQHFDALIHLANVQSVLKKFEDSLQNLQEALKVPNVSDENRMKTQQAIAYVKTQLAMTAPVNQAGSNPTVDTPAPVNEAIPQAATPVTQTPPVIPYSSITGWTQFTDPNEGAFHVDVPAGWKVEGGLARASAIDVRPWVRVTSPDQMINAFIGDGAICPSTIPNAQLTSLGFYPGSKYMGGLVLNYIPARRFAEKYAFTKLKPYAKDLVVVSEGNHPDAAHTLNGTVMASKSECASIKIAGTIKDIPISGLYVCATKASLGVTPGMWWVTYLAGEICPANREGEGVAVLARMMQSFALDPQWQAQSLQTTAQVSANYRANAQQVSKSIVDRYWSQQAANDRFNQGYWNRQASQDKAAENFSDYIRGNQNVADPNTGTQYKVPQADQHWIDPGGNIFGTTNGNPVSPDWTQLENVR